LQVFFLTDLREELEKGDGWCGGGQLGFGPPYTLPCPEVVESRQVKLIMRSTDLIMAMACPWCGQTWPQTRQ